MTTKNTFIDVFTDGSCPKNGKKNAIGGWAFYIETDVENLNKKMVSRKYKGQTATNMRCEIIAITNACLLIRKFLIKHELIDKITVRIITDSQFSIDALLTYIPSWTHNNWLKSNNKPPENLDLMKDLWKHYNALREVAKVRLKHIRSHKKEPTDKNSIEHYMWYGNFMADKLAGECINS